VTLHDVAVQYETRIVELQAGLAQLRLPHALTAGILTIAVALFLALGLYAVRGQMSFLWPSLPIPVAAASARRLRQSRQSESRMWRLKRFYDRALQRVKGNWARSGVTGDEFRPTDHVYATDLHLFGEGSLFELLCIARTSIGQRGLAQYLLKAPALEETLLRQEAVRELRGKVELRERIATLGEFEFLESRSHTFEEWLNCPRLSFPRALPTLAAVSSALLAAMIFIGFTSAIPWPVIAIWASPLVAFHVGAGRFYRSRVNRMLAQVRPLCTETGVLREGLRLLERDQFQSAKLKRLVELVQNSSAALRTLEPLLDALVQRDKEWFYGPSRWLLIGTQLCMAMEQWRREHGEALRIWLGAWAEFEALNALAAYSYENPDHTFPEFSIEACFEALDLGHPLLPQDSCVANDVELTGKFPFYIVSGSNMSGKSTLLRAIGLNAVLAFAGAPVRARALRLSGLSIFASLSIADSLLNGTSKFLAEVARLRQAIESGVENRPVLFLVDEIFSGTNSRDRRIAGKRWCAHS